jgi:hypothetical protein
MGIALREAKESSAALMKVRVCGLDNAHKAADLNLESGPVSLRRSSPRSS